MAPHGLKADTGPRRVILVVVDHSSAAREPAPRERSAPRTRTAQQPPSPSSPEASRYADRITVWGWSEHPPDTAGSDTRLTGTAVDTASSVLSGDGLEAVQAMPRVAGADDFRSEFSVRGSPYRQLGVVIDGVATPWLQHSVYGRRDAGSLSMFGNDLVDGLRLQVGAYPRRYEDALGAELQVTFRQGSRESTSFTARAGGTSAAFTGEGPIGTAGRGSWLVGVRNSYRAWPPGPLTQNNVGFAFADLHAKLVYDVSPTQQISVTGLGGRSTLDVVDEPLVAPLRDGTDRAGLLTVGWRLTLGSRTVLRQRASIIGQELVTTLPTGRLAGRAHNRALSYRTEIQHAVGGGLLDAGAEYSRILGARETEVDGPGTVRDPLEATWATRAAFLNFGRVIGRGVVFESGVRMSASTLMHQRAASPWIRGTWRFRQTWSVNASAGNSHQFATIDALLSPTEASELVPERATHLDVGIEYQRARVVWQATLFNRAENDVLRRLDLRPTLGPDVIFNPMTQGVYRNSVQGFSRGIELIARTDGRGPLSGWLSYTGAITRQTDLATGETFWGDADRRHGLNAAGVFRIGHRTSIGGVLRAASGIPIPGYFSSSQGRLIVGDHRNDVRLPAYARVDARVQRTFFSSRYGVTVFGELLNVLNRRNAGLADGSVQALTGEAVGFSRPLMSRSASAGIEVTFRR
ncbi:MAG: TonB-dependent receptor [Vicinamibacterales bacterium]